MVIEIALVHINGRMTNQMPEKGDKYLIPPKPVRKKMDFKEEKAQRLARGRNKDEICLVMEDEAIMIKNQKMKENPHEEGLKLQKAIKYLRENKKKRQRNNSKAKAFRKIWERQERVMKIQTWRKKELEKENQENEKLQESCDQESAIRMKNPVKRLEEDLEEAYSTSGEKKSVIYKSG